MSPSTLSMIRLKNKDLLTLTSFTPQEIMSFLQLAQKLKKQTKAGKTQQLLTGKTLAMIFDHPSTRTRVSFEVGMNQLGGAAINLNREDLQLGRGESIEDTGKTLSRYVDGILIRTAKHQTVEILAAASSVPVINGLTDLYHPCQALADLLTIYEKFGSFTGKKLAYIGDGNNVLHSLLHGAAAVGLEIRVATPVGYEPLASVRHETEQLALQTGATVTWTDDPKVAVQDADIVYTDVWASMGQEEEKEIRKQTFADYQITKELLQLASKQVIFMHCLPAYRGLEVTSEVIDGPRSVVFDQAENRLHAQNAVLVSLMGQQETDN